MTTESSPVLHRVTVEFVQKRTPTVYDFGSAEDAERCIETEKQNPEAWHIFHAVQKAPGDRSFILSSLYRSHETKEWRREHFAPQKTSDR